VSLIPVQTFLSFVQSLGARLTELVEGLGKMTRFASRAFNATLQPPLRLRRIWNELFINGVLSLSVVCISGSAVGMVLGVQLYRTLSSFGADEALGTAVGITLVTELGPVLTGLLVAGRAGSAMAGEIGSMVATEQLDGLRMMSIDPMDFVVSPKLIAMVVVMPLLSALFIMFGLCGGYLAGVTLLGVDAGSYWGGIESAITLEDHVAQSLLKALCFGALVGLIATYRGFHAAPNVEGVSRATTQAVVAASVSLLIADYFITALWGV
jgi:phospholipid/cholesterol/gamma-HCH transport system permease protein